MSNSLKSVAEIAGDAPNQIWSRTGQIGALMSMAGGLGFGVNGDNIEPLTALAYLPILAFSAFAMYYGGRLRKNLQIAQRNHDVQMRKSERSTSESTQGDEDFWKEFKANSPMNAKTLETLHVSHDRQKDSHALLSTINYLRFEGWVTRGKAVLYGNTYYTREQFKEKSRDMTIIVK